MNSQELKIHSMKSKKESRQVRRARERRERKGTEYLFTHEVYYIPIKRKSRAGVEYIYYKRVVDKKGLLDKKKK